MKAKTPVTHPSLAPASSHLALTGLFVALLSSTTAFAALPAFECLAESPQLIELGDDYYMLSADYTQAERDAHNASGLASDLFKVLAEGLLQTGSGQRTLCLGSGDITRPIGMRFELEQVEYHPVANGSGILSVLEDRETLETDRRDRRVSLDSLTLIGIELPPPATWTLGADGQSIVSSRRYRRGFSNTPRPAFTESSLVQSDMTARAHGSGSVEISETIYVNGYLSEQATWLLAR